MVASRGPLHASSLSPGRHSQSATDEALNGNDFVVINKMRAANNKHGFIAKCGISIISITHLMLIIDVKLACSGQWRLRFMRSCGWGLNRARAFYLDQICDKMFR